MKTNKCEMCGNKDYTVQYYWSGVFNKSIALCNTCVANCRGPKNAIEDYELSNFVIVRI